MKRTCSKTKRSFPANARADKPGKVQRYVAHLMLRVIVAAALFLLVFVSGNLLPQGTANVRQAVTQVLTSDVSLADSVQALGRSVKEGASWGEALRGWCVDTFLPQILSGEDTVSSPETLLARSALFHSHLLPQGVEQVPDLPPANLRAL